ncbi:hypothetical protein THRCLA_05272 [Thraustotheca clavata]|uniref:EF-hand domain-containing protein n=1 Tax=Thraustotheca clavata TaxID=74557 RepID=A0A1V9ZWE8_9STRA|nr:hypothetical protein THRCLA_05272 [Thraustotheca clavata]
MRKYQNDEAVTNMLKDFMQFMGSHFEQVGKEMEEKEVKEQQRQALEAAAHTPDEKAQVERILNDPELQAILSDTHMQNILKRCQEPGVLLQYLHDPIIGIKIRKLQTAGLSMTQTPLNNGVVAPVLEDLKRKKHFVRDYEPRSLGIFTLDNAFRKLIIHIVRHRYTHRITLCTVLINSLALGFVDYTDPWANGSAPTSGPTTASNQAIENIELITLAYFVLEACLKCIAYGILGPRGYWQNPWNKLDMVIVLSGIVSLFVSEARTTITSIRFLRILRPLRTVHSVPGLKILVNALLAALPAQLNISILLAFSYSVFAIIGLQIWCGEFHQRCRLTPYPVRLNFDPLNTTSISQYTNQTYINMVVADPLSYACPRIDVSNDNWTTPRPCFWPIDASDGQYCGSRQCASGRYCGSNYDALGHPLFYDLYTSTGNMLFSIMTEPDFTSNLNYGLAHFDTIENSLIVVLQTVTASGWMQLTENAQDAYSFVGSALYFNFVMFFGMCFLLQINMAIMVSAFEKASDAQEATRILEVQATMRKHTFRDRLKNQLAPLNRQLSESFKGPFYVRLRKKLTKLYSLRAMGIFNTIVTLINIIALASTHHDMNYDVQYALEVIEFGSLMWFFIDMILRIIEQEGMKYFGEPLNQFDCVSILIGLLDYYLHPPAFIDGTVSPASPFTALRALRALRLAQTWAPLKRLLLAMTSASGEILHFLFFLALFVYIFALMGMDLFATKFNFDSANRPIPYANATPAITLHRSNFDTIDAALFTVFQVLTYDNWPSIMYDGWLSVGAVAPLYFVGIIILGVWITMNMFTAITVSCVMNQVDGDTPPIDLASIHIMDEDGDYQTSHRYLMKLRYIQRSVHRLEPQLRKANLPHHTLQIRFPLQYACLQIISSQWWEILTAAAIATATIVTALDSPLLDTADGLGAFVDLANHLFAGLFAIEMVITMLAIGFKEYLRDPWKVVDGLIVLTSIAFWGFSSTSVNVGGIRALRTLRALRPLRVINQLPQLKVVINTLFRCLPEIAKSLVLFIYMLFIFGIAGVLFFKGALNTCTISPYNYLDNPTYSPVPPWFPPTYTGSYSMTDLKKYDIMTFPRSLNSMNPLSHSVMDPLWSTTCRFPSRDYVPTSMEMCTCFGSIGNSSTAILWKPQVPQNFDNILRAMGSFYELTTMEGWTAVAMASVDASGDDMQPIPKQKPMFYIFWVVFMIVGAFFMPNMFLGVLCDSFIREKYGGFVTDEQINWINLQRKLIALSPVVQYPRPKSRFRSFCYSIVTHKWFEHFMTICILLNTAIMTATYFGEPLVLDTSIDDVNNAFAVLFFLEALAKVSAIGVRVYFSNGWDRFDFTIVLMSCISICLPFVSGKSKVSTGLATILRVFRSGRALRLINKAKLLKSLFDTITVSLPAVANVTSLLMLLYYIFAAVGVQLFAKVAYGPNMVNSHQNFQTFWLAFQTLIGFSTGENWDNYLWELYAISPASNPTCVDPVYNGSMCGFNTFPGCVPLNGCGSWLIVPYFYIFMMVVGYIGLNLFSGIVVDAVADADATTASAVGDLPAFAQLWSKYDPNGEGLIKIDELCLILRQMPPPLGFRGQSNISLRRVQLHVGSLDLTIYDKEYVHFRDVPRALVIRSLSEGNPMRQKEISFLMNKMGITQSFHSHWAKRYKHLHRKIQYCVDVEPVANYVAAKTILRWFIQKVAKRRRAKNSLVRNEAVRSTLDELVLAVEIGENTSERHWSL